MANFEVSNPEIQAKMKDIGKMISSALPKGWGFSLMIFNYGDKGNMFYISSGKREDMIEAMKEFIERNTH